MSESLEQLPNSLYFHYGIDRSVWPSELLQKSSDFSSELEKLTDG